MRERPILFSGPMVRALLADKKTQTRRVVKDQSSVSDVAGGGVEPVIWWPRDGDNLLPCPYGSQGDQLWVREMLTRSGGMVQYAADLQATKIVWPASWRQDPRPSIHMPRVFSRITLELTDVRVQRVQEISEEDAQAEGCDPCPRCKGEGTIIAWQDGMPGGEECPEYCYGRKARGSFAALWDSINEKRGFGWSNNPWCWCISFRRLET